ncbi:MAG: D-alanyl-D-alanine carboxypeptidase/D-alanyl-D-alanine-endopeptidase [Myxococcota bacterium]
MFATPLALMFVLAQIGTVPVPAAGDPAPPPIVADGDGRAQPAVTALVRSFADLDVGTAIRCTADDRMWGANDADELLNAASGTKLLTTAAALHQLAPDTRWPTVAYGARAGDAVNGDLVIVANGDPWLDADALDRLAVAIRKAGIKSVSGDLVADTSRFDGPLLPPAYDQKATDAAYRPAVAALGISFGAMAVSVRPGKAIGDPVRVSTTPTVPSIVVDNSARTVEGKAQTALTIDARPGKDGKTRILVGGTLGVKAQALGTKRRVESPAHVALDVLAAALKKRGVSIRGAVRVATDRPAHGAELARIESRPLAEIVHEINTFSNNYMAETLFAHLGEQDGDHAQWARAAKAVAQALAELHLPAGGYRIVNGSGLYDGTHVSPRAMAALLDAMADGAGPAEVAFRDSLAIAGKTGTLKGRLKKLAGKVIGKTGTLDDALSLSGYVTAKSGCRLAFSVIVNGPIGDRAGKVQVAIDGLVSALAEL